MPKITPGNRLYLYRLLKNEVGANHQVLISKIEEVFTQDGFDAEDLGCNDIVQLLEQLSEFIKLTVFKKGRTYATVLENQEYDQILEREAHPAPKSDGGKGGKPWKRRKGSKDPKPAKPRHHEKEQPAKVEPTPEPEPEPAPAPEDAEKNDELADEANEPQVEATVAEASAVEVEVAPEPEPEPAPKPEPEPAPEPAPEPQPEPSINLTITYDPYELMNQELDQQQKESEKSAETSPAASTPAPAPAPAPESTLAPAPTTAPAPKPAPTPAPAPAPSRTNLPESFSTEVHCKDELLRLLYQALPIDADIMLTLDEDWRVARSTGTLTGNRSRVSFPLRYQHEDGSGPVTLTIHRSSRPIAGKHWSLELVDDNDGSGPAHEPAGLEGLPTIDGGAWSDLASPRYSEEVSPARELAQFAVIGSWDNVLGTLATMAAPERWNYPGEGVGGPSRYGILREYLTVNFYKARKQDRIAQAADGSLAAFNTGLLTPFAEQIYMVFSPNAGDIPWKLEGFCTNGSGELGGRLAATLPQLPAPASYLTSLSDVAPEPGRMLILDTDALLGRQLSRLPRSFLTDQLSSNADASRLLTEALEKGNGKLDRSATRDVARAIKSDPGLFRRMGQAISDAAELALCRAKASYRIAVPAYEPASDSMRLLLPLCLVSDNKADCAISLELMASGAYRATSVTSLPRAYASARVISAEQPSWLSPDVVLG